MFSKDMINTISTIIELSDENQTRVPVAYRGSLFYVYSIDEKALCLVPINAIYSEYSQHQGKLWFIPSQLVQVASDDVDIDYIIEMILKPQVQVAIQFAELEQQLEIHHMRIVLKNVEMLSINVEDNESTYKPTFKYYTYDEEDESYILND